MTYQIRAMCPDDAAQVASVHVASWQAAYRGMIDDEILDKLNLAEREARWRSNLEGDDYNLENIVCLSDNHIIGFACYGEEREPEGTERGELWAIYVHPDFWGKGAGRVMWAYFSIHRQKYKKGSVVWVLSKNTAAIRFYETLGFKTDGHTKDFIHSGKSFPERRMIL